MRLCIFLILPFPPFFKPCSLTVTPCWSHHFCVSFIDVGVCLRSCVDEQGTLGRCVNSLPALVLIGGARSRVTGPTQVQSDNINGLYNRNALPGSCKDTVFSKQGLWFGLLYKTLRVVYVLWKPKATLNIIAVGYKSYIHHIWCVSWWSGSLIWQTTHYGFLLYFSNTGRF